MINYLVYGFGGFGQLICSLIKKDFPNAHIGVFDDTTPSSLPNYIEYLGSYRSDKYPLAPIIIAIGDNDVREKITHTITHQYFTYIHPSAFVADNQLILNGSIVLQNVVIQNNSSIGSHCIIQPNVVIDHDVKIADFSHIYPHSYIGSNSKISAKSLLKPSSMIDRNSII